MKMRNLLAAAFAPLFDTAVRWPMRDSALMADGVAPMGDPRLAAEGRP
jgi:hypothetical protein